MKGWYSVGPQRLKRIKDARNLCDDLDIWENGFKALADRPFYCGQNDRGWRAGPEYILALSHMETIIDSGYEYGEKPVDPWLEEAARQSGGSHE